MKTTTYSTDNGRIALQRETLSDKSVVYNVFIRGVVYEKMLDICMRARPDKAVSHD